MNAAEPPCDCLHRVHLRIPTSVPSKTDDKWDMLRKYDWRHREHTWRFCFLALMSCIRITLRDDPMSVKKRIRKFRERFADRGPFASNIETRGGFELFHFRNSDGSFDYEKYRKAQIAGNERKLHKVWVLEENIAFFADYIKKTVPDVRLGICHGTRRGREQEWFRKHLGAEVIGTEISPTADQFPHTIEWDFHEVKPEWVGAVDFIYSNSLDHSFDPEKCLNAWMSCVREGGVCLLEHTSDHETATRLDPFGASLFIMPYLVLTWGKGRYSVREILDTPSKDDSSQHSCVLVIQRN